MFFPISPANSHKWPSGLRLLWGFVRKWPLHLSGDVHVVSGLIDLWDIIHSGFTPHSDFDLAPLSPVSCRSQCLIVTHGLAQGQNCLLSPLVTSDLLSYNVLLLEVPSCKYCHVSVAGWQIPSESDLSTLGFYFVVSHTLKCAHDCEYPAWSPVPAHSLAQQGSHLTLHHPSPGTHPLLFLMRVVLQNNLGTGELL